MDMAIRERAKKRGAGMVAEYIGKILTLFKEKPDTMAIFGFAIMVGSAMIGWTITMYLGGGMALVGYLISSRKKGKVKKGR